jgi:hypothetical protein
VTTYAGIDVPADAWGLDSAISGALTDAQLQALIAFDFDSLGTIPGLIGPKPTGKPVVLWFYSPLYGLNASSWDANIRAMQTWCDLGGLAGMVQHCPSGLWTASAQHGENNGKRAAEIASLLGYPTDANHCQDDEAVANPGPDAVADVYGWAKAYSSYGEPGTYEGYEPGLSQLQEYDNPLVDRYWGALGDWNVATRSVCCRQGPTIRINGVAYDLDHFFPDKLGGVMRLMGRPDLWPSPSAQSVPPPTV